MSHIVQIQTQVRDRIAVEAACRRLGLAAPVEGTFQLFTNKVTGLSVQLPSWRYPVVCQLASGELAFDNYQGRWGEQSFLDNFLQAYAVERTKLEARKKGYSITEQALADGSIKLTVAMQGGVA